MEKDYAMISKNMLCYIRCQLFTRCRSTAGDIVPKVGVKCNVEREVYLDPKSHHTKQSRLDVGTVGAGAAGGQSLHFVLRLERSNGRLATLGLTTSTIVVIPFRAFFPFVLVFTEGTHRPIASRRYLFSRPPQLWRR